MNYTIQEKTSGYTYETIYNELKNKAYDENVDAADRWSVFTTLPKGIYKINGAFYLVPEDVALNIYQMQPPSELTTTTYNGDYLIQNSRWIYKINESSRLYTYADFDPYNAPNGYYYWYNVSSPQNGMLFLDIQGSVYRYYYCLFQTDDKYSNCGDKYPSQNEEAWMDITDWVTTVTESASE